jgi:hypothetical protein
VIYLAVTDTLSWGKADRTDQAVICAIGFAEKRPSKVDVYAIDTDDFVSVGIDHRGQLLHPPGSRVKRLGEISDADLTCRTVHHAWTRVRANLPRFK